MYYEVSMSLVGLDLPTIGGAPPHSIHQPALCALYRLLPVGDGGSRSIRGTSARLPVQLQRCRSHALGLNFKPLLQGLLETLGLMPGSHNREVVTVEEGPEIPFSVVV